MHPRSIRHREAEPTSPSVYFLTLGCPKNEVDSDRMKAALLASDFAVTEDPQTADFAIVNTCSFIQDAVEESIQTILDVAMSWLPAKEGRRLVVAGCLPSRYGRDLADAMPEVDAFVPVREEAALVDVLERLSRAGTDDSAPGPASGPLGAPGTEPCPPRTLGAPSAYLQISDGCHRRCSYCTIPAIRGPYRSRPLDEIVEEAALLVAGGAREIVLVGQDVSAYGHDLGRGRSQTGRTDAQVRGSHGPRHDPLQAPGLADVVRELAHVPGLAWLRLMYVQPDGITQELLDVMLEEPVVCHYLDMPLQHASASVLKAMHRRGSGAEFLRLIAHIRAVMPDVVLRTSLIAGFPGETPEAVRALVHFLESARLDYAGVFPYSPEEGTAAAALPALPSRRTRLSRAQRLRDISDRIGFEKAAARVGTTLEVLIEGRDDEGAIVGRWRGQAPEVDGVVVMDGAEPGDILRARVVDSLGYDLVAEVI